jgi:hypothetical protein
MQRAMPATSRAAGFDHPAMNPLIQFALLPAIGNAPHAGIFWSAISSPPIHPAGYVILATAGHATKGERRCVVARKA